MLEKTNPGTWAPSLRFAKFFLASRLGPPPNVIVVIFSNYLRINLLLIYAIVLPVYFKKSNNQQIINEYCIGF
jgi:hypothetical protein